jgi:pyruvate-ferredoxin/flavodoxin oxidoreductase
MTTSHLRFGKKYIRAPYLVQEADFIACHNFSFLEKYDMLARAKTGGTFLLNAPFGPDEIWNNMPKEVQQQIIDKKLKFYVIDGVKLGNEIGLGPRINVIMQTAFFKISNIIPLKTALAEIKDAIKKSYGKAGEAVLAMNYKAVDAGLNNLSEVKVPAKATSKLKMAAAVSAKAPKFVKEVTGVIVAGLGDSLPVSKMPAVGTFPTATSQYEKKWPARSTPSKWRLRTAPVVAPVPTTVRPRTRRIRITRLWTCTSSPPCGLRRQRISISSCRFRTLTQPN